MAAAAGFTTSIQSRLYHTTTPLASPSQATVAALAVTGNEVEHTREIGQIGQSANNIVFNEYGKSTQTSVAGPTPLSDFTVTFSVDYTNAKHQALVSANAGDKCAWVVETIVGAGETQWYLEGTILSRNIAPGTASEVTQCVVEVALVKAPSVYHKA